MVRREAQSRPTLLTYAQGCISVLGWTLRKKWLPLRGVHMSEIHIRFDNCSYQMCAIRPLRTLTNLITLQHAYTGCMPVGLRTGRLVLSQ